MPHVSAFLRAAAISAVGAALVTTHTVLCAHPLPSCMLSTSNAHLMDAVASMRLQDQGIPWDIEGDDFHNGYDPKTVQLQILRLRAEYVDSTGSTSPVMRIVGFFPGVSTSSVYEHLTNVSLRRAWDVNYTHFEQFAGKCPTTLGNVDELRRPLAAVAKTRAKCSGDVCTLVPDVTSVELDNGWFSHRVGGALMRRFGLADRLFQYERHSYAHSLGTSSPTSVNAAPTPQMYDVLFSGSKRAREKAAIEAPQLGAWLRANRDAVACEEVNMNFQHILLIPIADAPAQLFGNSEQLRQLCIMGSMLDLKSTKLVYDVWKKTHEQVLRGTDSFPGTLLVMTSANDVSVPAFFPRWAQKTILATMSRKAYGLLLKACLQRSADEGAM
ncbi:hypothetical protein LSCM1_04575 [Leishmania martiniquensis]|uniref:Uncharacterized protein n=1 Tax=Leishmania martiniquensis TaxID=1580590 RepID=A0A836GHT0_9TRYP|nr:hypothetical protein LSCM1_04575 [Leishmania martiniquensis]